MESNRMNDDAKEVDISESDDMKVFRLPELIREGVPISQLADAIEMQGIQGWDRFGRFKTFTAATDPERQAALDFLAQQHAWLISTDDDEGEIQSPLDRVDIDSQVEYLGWKTDNLPKFEQLAALRAADPVAPMTSQQRRKLNADEALIAALFLLIQEGYEFTTQEDLAGYLEHQNAAWPGLSAKNIKTKLAQANSYFTEYRETLYDRRRSKAKAKAKAKPEKKQP
jgi:hypothetical protein